MDDGSEGAFGGVRRLEGDVTQVDGSPLIPGWTGWKCIKSRKRTNYRLSRDLILLEKFTIISNISKKVQDLLHMFRFACCVRTTISGDFDPGFLASYTPHPQ
jgi:hypothetical protein